MKAEIDGEGTLYIKPETPLEQYALGKWCEENDKLVGRIIIHARIDTPTPGDTTNGE